MTPILRNDLQRPAAPPSVWASYLLIGLNILLWLAFGVITAGGFHPALPDQPLVRAVLGGGALAVALALALLLYFLVKRSRAAYFLTLGLLLALALVTIFDDFGWIDLAVALINLAPAVLLLIDRPWHLHPAHV